MPLTQLDPSPALVVIDLQKGIVGMPCGPHATADVVKRSAELASESANAIFRSSWSTSRGAPLGASTRR